jgi:hypothetical protein
MSRPKAESCPLQEANEFCGGVHAQRRLLAALARWPGPVPARLQTAADRIEVRLLNEQRAIRQSLRGRRAPRNEGSHQVAMVRLDKQQAAWPKSSPQIGEDLEIVFLSSVAERREDVECAVESILAERSSEVMYNISQLGHRELSALPLGKLQKRRGLVDTNHNGPALRQGTRQAPIAARSIEYSAPILKAEDGPESLNLGSDRHRVVTLTPQAKVISVKECFPPVAHALSPLVVGRTLRISCEAVPPSVQPAGAQGGTSARRTGAALSFVSCIRLFGGLEFILIVATLLRELVSDATPTSGE